MGNRRVGAPGPSRDNQGLRPLGDQIDGRTRTDPVPNQSGLAALGDAVDRSRQGRGTGTGGTGRRRRSSRRRWSTRRKVFTSLVALLVLALLAAAGLYAYARYRYDQIPKVTVSAEQKAVSGQSFNMLVTGSDSRLGAKASTGIGTTTTVGGQRSDVIMVWHVVPATKKITILSIAWDVTAPGCSLLNGKEALSVARSRHYQYEVNGQWLDTPSERWSTRPSRSSIPSSSTPSWARRGVPLDHTEHHPDLHAAHHDNRGRHTVLFVNQPADQELFGSQLTHPTSPPPDTTRTPATPPAVSATSSTAAPSTAPPPSPTKTPTFDPTPC